MGLILDTSIIIAGERGKFDLTGMLESHPDEVIRIAATLERSSSKTPFGFFPLCRLIWIVPECTHTCGRDWKNGEN